MRTGNSSAPNNGSFRDRNSNSRIELRMGLVGKLFRLLTDLYSNKTSGNEGCDRTKTSSHTKVIFLSRTCPVDDFLAFLSGTFGLELISRAKKSRTKRYFDREGTRQWEVRSEDFELFELQNEIGHLSVRHQNCVSEIDQNSQDTMALADLKFEIWKSFNFQTVTIEAKLSAKTTVLGAIESIKEELQTHGVRWHDEAWEREKVYRTKNYIEPCFLCEGQALNRVGLTLSGQETRDTDRRLTVELRVPYSLFPMSSDFTLPSLPKELARSAAELTALESIIKRHGGHEMTLR